MSDLERPVITLATLGEAFDRAAELAAMRPVPRLVAAERSVRISADGAWLAHRDGTSSLTESGTVTYAEGVVQIRVYRVADRAQVLAREYPYYWNDGGSPSGSEIVDDFDFSPDGAALIVTFARGWGRSKQKRDERIPLP